MKVKGVKLELPNGLSMDWMLRQFEIVDCVGQHHKGKRPREIMGAPFRAVRLKLPGHESNYLYPVMQAPGFTGTFDACCHTEMYLSPGIGEKSEIWWKLITHTTRGGLIMALSTKGLLSLGTEKQGGPSDWPYIDPEQAIKSGHAWPAAV